MNMQLEEFLNPNLEFTIMNLDFLSSLKSTFAFHSFNHSFGINSIVKKNQNTCHWPLLSPYWTKSLVLLQGIQLMKHLTPFVSILAILISVLLSRALHKECLLEQYIYNYWQLAFILYGGFKFTMLKVLFEIDKDLTLQAFLPFCNLLMPTNVISYNFKGFWPIKMINS